MTGDLIDRLWYRQSKPLALLAPLAWLYRSVAQSRRRKAWTALAQALPVPVLVVGNITAGGTGKSPLTARLVSLMRDNGWRPVILSRGYGGRSSEYPLLVTPDTPVDASGDEPLMLAMATGCPVVVDPDRSRAAQWALDHALGNVLICDDGLQHYRLPRDIELAVFDAARGIGNGAMIPVGPLREPVERLQSVDFVVVNGAEFPSSGERITEYAGQEHPGIHAMALRPSMLVNMSNGEQRPPDALKGRPVTALAGIGNPGRFFSSLRALGAEVTERPFSDHHRFKPSDLAGVETEWLVMTAKDAVKCRPFAPENAWVLTVEAELSDPFEQTFLERLAACAAGADEFSIEQDETRHG